MKTAVNMFLLLSAIYFVGLGFSTSDFGLRCTKCLRDYHVVERQFFGYTYRKWNTLRFDGYDSEQLYGRPCSHIYRKGGFGRSFGGLWASGVGCGTTADGTLFRNRWNTIKAAVELEGKLDNPALFQRTVTLADTILPADATTADVQDENRFFAPPSPRLPRIPLGEGDE